MALSYFYEELPDLHVIAAGSLLEFAMREISFPVGRVHFLTMYPLTLPNISCRRQTGCSGNNRGKTKRLSGAVHALLMDELRRYFFVGGMPQAVKAYADPAQ